jgi:eukaryotic-like serine/threonine-protein kinase
MKLVAGRPLSELISDAKTPEQRLALLHHVIAVADAVAYAHSKGILHRDLKPANVIVGQFGETVVIDWGLAKDLKNPTSEVAEAEPKDHDRSNDITLRGSILGTPAYMSPEQAGGMPVDERTDVYSIGVMLRQVVATPSEDPHGERETLPRELLSIISKATAKAASSRYTGPADLADDLRRYQMRSLVAAHSYSTWERLGSVVRRHKPIATALAISLFTLVASAVISSVRIVRERNAAIRAQQVATEARAQAETERDTAILANARALLERDPTGALSTLTAYRGTDPLPAALIASEAFARGIPTHRLRPSTYLGAMVTDGNLTLAAFQLPNREIAIWDPDSNTARHIPDETAEISVLAVSPQGSIVAIARNDATITIRDTRRLDVQAQLPATRLTHLWFQDEIHLCAANGIDIHCWNLAQNSSELIYRSASAITSIAFAAADIATCDNGGAVWIHAGERTAVGACTSRPDALVFSPDAKRLLIRNSDGSARVWDLAAHQSRTFALSASTLASLPSGAQGLVTAHPDGRVIYDDPSVNVSRILATVPARPTALVSAGTSAPIIAVGFDDGTISVHRGPHLDRHRLLRHGGRVGQLAASTTGRVMSLSLEEIKVWTVDDSPTTIAVSSRGLYQLALGDEAVYVGDREGRINRVSTSDGSTKVLAKHDHLSNRLSISADRTQLVSSGWDSAIVYIETPSGREAYRASGFAIATDLIHVGRTHSIISGHTDGHVLFWPNPAQSQVLNKHGKRVRRIAATSDGRYAATTSDDSTVGLYDLDTRRSVTLQDASGPTTRLTFAGDSYRLYVGSQDGFIRAYDLSNGATSSLTPFAALRAIDGPATHVAVTADGKIVGAWDRNYVAVLSPQGETIAGTRITGGLVTVIVARDALVAIGTTAGITYLIDTSHSGIAAVHDGSAYIQDVAFFGNTIISSSEDGLLRSWNLDEIHYMPIQRDSLAALLSASARVTSYSPVSQVTAKSKDEP